MEFILSISITSGYVRLETLVVRKGIYLQGFDKNEKERLLKDI